MKLISSDSAKIMQNMIHQSSTCNLKFRLITRFKTQRWTILKQVSIPTRKKESQSKRPCSAPPLPSPLTPKTTKLDRNFQSITLQNALKVFSTKALSSSTTLQQECPVNTTTIDAEITYVMHA